MNLIEQAGKLLNFIDNYQIILRRFFLNNRRPPAQPSESGGIQKIEDLGTRKLLFDKITFTSTQAAFRGDPSPCRVSCVSVSATGSG